MSDLLPAITPPVNQKPQPLILSPALTPIPSKIVEHIQKKENVEMKELLTDNVALLKKIQEVNTAVNAPAIANASKLREVTDPLTWVFCFHSFIAAKVNHPETKQLVAYAQIVIDLARKHPGAGWLTYDSLFRQQLNARASFQWHKVNPSSWLPQFSVLSSRNAEGSRVCTPCTASNHSDTDYALASLEAPKTPLRPLISTSTQPPFKTNAIAPYQRLQQMSPVVGLIMAHASYALANMNIFVLHASDQATVH